MKPGTRTTELWLTLAIMVGNLLAAVDNQLPPKWASIASVISGGLYALARGWAKSGTPTA